MLLLLTEDIDSGVGVERENYLLGVGIPLIRLDQLLVPCVF